MTLVMLSAAYGDDEIRGTIASIDAAAGTLEISGVMIRARDAAVKNTMDNLCALADLKVGDRVDVEGTFSGPAEMTAIDIEQRRTVTDGVKGKLRGVDDIDHILTVSGITVKVAPGARLEGDVDAWKGFFGIKIGEDAECEGKWTGKKELTAHRIHID
jgi:hypothetical protein